jgi:hypothetical protein
MDVSVAEAAVRTGMVTRLNEWFNDGVENRAIIEEGISPRR